MSASPSRSGSVRPSNEPLWVLGSTSVSNGHAAQNGTSATNRWFDTTIRSPSANSASR
jgi:hypothetical protein